MVNLLCLLGSKVASLDLLYLIRALGQLLVVLFSSFTQVVCSVLIYPSHLLRFSFVMFFFFFFNSSSEENFVFLIKDDYYIIYRNRLFF